MKQICKVMIFIAPPLMLKINQISNQRNKVIYGKSINNYQTFEKVHCLIDSEELIVKPGQNEIEFTFTNTYNKNITFDNIRFIGVFQGS